MNSRDENGRIKPLGNTFKEIDGIIYVYRGEEMLFFTDDKRVVEHNWCKLANGYYSTHIDGKQIPAHRFISSPEDYELVDHINRNKKDNTLANLRNTNKSINAFNSKKRKNNKSGVAGVWFRKDTKKWCAEIKVNGTKITLGCFEEFSEAVKTREEAEEFYYGNQ